MIGGTSLNSGESHMKTLMTTLFALVSFSVGTSVSAEAAAMLAQRPQVVAPAKHRSSDSAAAKLSPEEMAFVAKLSDANRRVFIEKLSAEQRQAAMKAAKKATVSNAPDEAVSRIFHGHDLALVEIEEKDAIASADELMDEIQDEDSL